MERESKGDKLEKVLFGLDTRCFFNTSNTYTSLIPLTKQKNKKYCVEENRHSLFPDAMIRIILIGKREKSRDITYCSHSF